MQILRLVILSARVSTLVCSAVVKPQIIRELAQGFQRLFYMTSTTPERRGPEQGSGLPEVNRLVDGRAGTESWAFYKQGSSFYFSKERLQRGRFGFSAQIRGKKGRQRRNNEADSNRSRVRTK